MIRNNNLSVLPWYSSIEEQNARKWWAYGRVYPLYTPAMFLLPFQIMREHREGVLINAFQIYTAKGEFVGDFTQAIIESGLVSKTISYSVNEEPVTMDVLVYPGRFPAFTQFPDGQYYAKMSDGVDTWYSEVFTAIQDIRDYLRIVWWDDEDVLMDAGVISYKNPAFKNVVFLESDLAKPEYPYEEEGETRDGYFFPIKQISEKRFRFSFLASEYLLDVIRFVPMADHAYVVYRGAIYPIDSFTFEHEWLGDGDVASVDASFDTATIVKKIGRGYTLASQHAFDDSFNYEFDSPDTYEEQ